MNFYEMLAARVGSAEARLLAESLTAWHDEMVLHRRRATRDPSSEPCGPECPYHAARFFWNEARRVFGDAARELTFLRASVASLRVHADGGAKTLGSVAAGPT